MPNRLICLVLVWIMFANRLSAQVFDERFDDWPVDLTVHGQVIIVPSVAAESLLHKFIDGDWNEEQLWLVVESESAIEPFDILKNVVGKRFTYEQLSAQISTEGVKAELPKVMLWIENRTADAIPAERLEQLANFFRAFVRQGGSLLVVGEAGESASRFIVTQDSGELKLLPGMNLLPDCILQVTSSDDTAASSQLAAALREHPECVGVSLTNNTALVLSGRKMRVAGKGQAAFVLHSDDAQAERRQAIFEANGRERPSKWMVDLTQWRREAKERTLPAFPPAMPQAPYVESGTLLIVGGGGMPKGLMDQFIELAGGQEAKLVYVPCVEEPDVNPQQGMVEEWKQRGVQHATFIHTKDRNQANKDDEFLEPLRDATGIWFGGGRQWNLSDSYYGTQAHRLMKEVLARGGVIGGSSAGASIQARYLARATPIENFDIMAPGYERGGLGFISGVAIDQHFSQRNRHSDMTSLVERYPQLLGIGIDEATAIVVRKSTAEVVGRGKVHFYDRRRLVIADEPDFMALEAGQTYDLKLREVLTDVAK